MIGCSWWSMVRSAGAVKTSVLCLNSCNASANFVSVICNLGDKGCTKEPESATVIASSEDLYSQLIKDQTPCNTFSLTVFFHTLLLRWSILRLWLHYLQRRETPYQKSGNCRPTWPCELCRLPVRTKVEVVWNLVWGLWAGFSVFWLGMLSCVFVL